MEIVIAAVVVALGLAAGLVLAASLLARRAPALVGHRRPGAPKPAAAAQGGRGEADAADLKERRTEMVRLEERLLSKEETLDSRLAGLAEREQELLVSTEENAGAKERHIRELERVSGLSASQAKQILLHELEDQIRHDSARRVRQIEEETKRDADRRVRNILSVVMQRMAAGHAAETTGLGGPALQPTT